MTLFHEILDAAAGLNPARPALRHQGQSVTYDEVRGRSLAVAAGLRARGVRRGDRVAVYLKNRPEAVEVALACSRIGAIFVPINPILKSRQLGYLLRDCGARTLILSTSALPGVAEELEGSPALHDVVACDSPGRAAGDLSVRITPYEELRAGSETEVPSEHIDKDPAAIMYTSSSTGPPKGVVVSHHNLASGARCVASYLGNHRDDRILAALPLSFDYGFSQVSTAFAVGACAVLTHYSLATALLQEVEAEAITGLAGVPTMWAHLAASEWSARATETVRYITNSGGAIAPAVSRKLQTRLPRTLIYSMYGLTEAFRSTFLHPAELAERPRSIGKAVPNQEVLVLRPDGSECEADEQGELVHRGSLVTLGYWGDAALTRARFKPLAASKPGLVDEIAVWSGDIVTRDGDGFLYFVGRKDQQIKTSGYRVSPTEVEEIVLEVPGTVEAIAVGLADEVLGQLIALAVVEDGRHGDAIVESVRQHCRRHLPAFMVPAHIFRVESIARTANGKQDRATLRAELEALVEQCGIESRRMDG